MLRLKRFGEFTAHGEVPRGQERRVAGVRAILAQAHPGIEWPVNPHAQEIDDFYDDQDDLVASGVGQVSLEQEVTIQPVAVPERVLQFVA